MADLAQEILSKSPEEIQRMMEAPEGVSKIKKAFKDNPEAAELFRDKLAQVDSQKASQQEQIEDLSLLEKMKSAGGAVLEGVENIVTKDIPDAFIGNLKKTASEEEKSFGQIAMEGMGPVGQVTSGVMSGAANMITGGDNILTEDEYRAVDAAEALTLEAGLAAPFGAVGRSLRYASGLPKIRKFLGESGRLLGVGTAATTGQLTKEEADVWDAVTTGGLASLIEGSFGLTGKAGKVLLNRGKKSIEETVGALKSIFRPTQQELRLTDESNFGKFVTDLVTEAPDVFDNVQTIDDLGENIVRKVGGVNPKTQIHMAGSIGDDIAKSVTVIDSLPKEGMEIATQDGATVMFRPGSTSDEVLERVTEVVNAPGRKFPSDLKDVDRKAKKFWLEAKEALTARRLAAKGKLKVDPKEFAKSGSHEDVYLAKKLNKYRSGLESQLGEAQQELDSIEKLVGSGRKNVNVNGKIVPAAEVYKGEASKLTPLRKKVTALKSELDAVDASVSNPELGYQDMVDLRRRADDRVYQISQGEFAGSKAGLAEREGAILYGDALRGMLDDKAKILASSTDEGLANVGAKLRYDLNRFHLLARLREVYPRIDQSVIRAKKDGFKTLIDQFYEGITGIAGAKKIARVDSEGVLSVAADQVENRFKQAERVNIPQQRGFNIADEVSAPASVVIADTVLPLNGEFSDNINERNQRAAKALAEQAGVDIDEPGVFETLQQQATQLFSIPDQIRRMFGANSVAYAAALTDVVKAIPSAFPKPKSGIVGEIETSKGKRKLIMPEDRAQYNLKIQDDDSYDDYQKAMMQTAVNTDGTVVDTPEKLPTGRISSSKNTLDRDK